MSDRSTILIAAALLAAVTTLRAASATRRRASKRRAPGGTTPRRPSAPVPARPRGPYPGDFTGSVGVSYTPSINGQPDPGEVVWTWVPYEEDFTQGKDRPVLLIGRDHEWLLGLMLTSKDHNRDAADEARWGRHWMDVGAGSWDSHGRPSEIRLDRVVRVDPWQVRREGAILDQVRFDGVIGAARKVNHW